MKKILLLSLSALLGLSGLKAQTLHTVSVNGFAYDPAELTVNVGDSVSFTGTDFHPLVQVSEATWSANGATALDGGFNFPNGQGKIECAEVDTIYYVCTAHVLSNGMKGKIFVVAVPTGVHNLSESDFSSVYPVPLSGDVLTVSFKNPVQDNLQVYIYDLVGNLRLTASGSTTDGIYKLDCKNLPRGVFLMKLKTDEGNSFTKLVRE